MDNWQPQTLTWSFTQRGRFETCRRRYFYKRFWGQDPKTRWRLYEMRNITSLPMMRGDIVHSVIAGALAAIRDGRPMDIGSARESITDTMRERCRESYYKMWHVDNRPPGKSARDITNLLEHYYKHPDVEECIRESRKHAWQCIENLFGSELWAGIAGSDPQTWREVEEGGFPSFDLDGIKVYAIIDFAHTSGGATIIDWKTGSPDPNDHDQLVLYSLYAQSKWGWDPRETRLAAVYLQPELVAEELSPSQEDLDSVVDLVKRSFNEMLELEPAFGPANVEDFPITEDAGRCRWCRFQGICDGAERVKGLEG